MTMSAMSPTLDPSAAEVATAAAADAARSPQTNPESWQLLAGLHPEATKYPARANIAGDSIVVFRTRTGFRGVQRSCPHMQATMMSADLVANDTMIRCSLHVFTFRLSDGKGVNCPGFRVRVYEVKEENGVLYGRTAN
jgi:nitrite reductase/ring-hydroxylating ferredoxin subunit